MKKSNLTLLIGLFATLNLLGQTNYYVSLSGNNSNTGTSIAQAWRTVQYAMFNAPPNSIVNILGGTYAKGWIGVSGTPNNFITFKNYDGQEVIIDGGSTGSQTILIGMDGASYIRIEGLILKNATGNFSSGIYISNGSHHIEVINNKISNVHFSNNPNATVTDETNVNPLVVYNENATQSCNNILIQGNEIFDCRTGYSEALTLSGNVENFEVSDNLVHDITNIGIDIAGGYGVSSNPANDFARNGVVKENITYNCVSEYAVSAGIYIDGGQDIIVERNRSYQNGRGFEIGCEELNHVATNITVRNNLSYNNLEAGIGIGGYNYPSKTGKVTNSYISNNSFYNNNTSNKDSEGELLIEYTENCMIKNNIFYATNANRFLIVSRLNSQNINLDYNLYYHTGGTSTVKVDWEGAVYTGFSNYQAGVNQDAHSNFNNPLFLNTAIPNLNLSSNSPAINTGDPTFTPSAGETDFAGQNRLQNTRVDIGAYEYQNQQCPTSLNLTGSISTNTYETSGLLTANGMIQNGAQVSFKAESITLNTGFYALAGSIFSAIIAPCTAAVLSEPATTYRSSPVVIADKEAINSLDLQVFPNPMSQKGTVAFSLPATTAINLSLYNANGQLSQQLLRNQFYEKGNHQFDLNTTDLIYGFYFLQLQTEKYQQVVKLSVLNK